MTPLATKAQVVQGDAIALFAFDVGYEIDLARVGQLLPAQPVRPISRAKQTPPYLQYTRPPLVVSLGETLDLPGDLRGKTGQIEAKIFDFGAISISYRWALNQKDMPLALEDLPGFSKMLFDCNLESQARAQVVALIQTVRAAITRPVLSDLVEDYYVFSLEQLESAESAPVTAEKLLSQYESIFAQTLRFEVESLSLEQQKDALGKTISYYQNDLALIDWNAAILIDSDYVDTLNVLELLNVELLEARYLDSELDKRLQSYENVVQKQPRWFLPLLSPYRKTLQELAELRIESALLAERVDNSLKLIGDLYLARIHAAVSERFYIATWDASISRKLDIIGNLYQLLTDRISTTQAQTLELIIIILIGLEILISRGSLKLLSVG